VQFLRQNQISILKILIVCLRFKSSLFLNLNRIEHFSKVSIFAHLRSNFQVEIKLSRKKQTNLCPCRNSRFRTRTRPQSFCNRRRSRATLRIAKRRERSHGLKDAVYGWTLTCFQPVHNLFGGLNRFVDMRMLMCRGYKKRLEL